jgi:hypothetical protein
LQYAPWTFFNTLLTRVSLPLTVFTGELPDVTEWDTSAAGHRIQLHKADGDVRRDDGFGEFLRGLNDAHAMIAV